MPSICVFSSPRARYSFRIWAGAAEAMCLVGLEGLVKITCLPRQVPLLIWVFAWELVNSALCFPVVVFDPSYYGDVLRVFTKNSLMR